MWIGPVWPQQRHTAVVCIIMFPVYLRLQFSCDSWAGVAVVTVVAAAAAATPLISADRFFGNCTVSAASRTYARDLTIVDKRSCVAARLSSWWNALAETVANSAAYLLHGPVWTLSCLSRPRPYSVCQRHSLERVSKDWIRWVMTLWRYWFNMFRHFQRKIHCSVWLWCENTYMISAILSYVCTVDQKFVCSMQDQVINSRKRCFRIQQ